MSLRRSLWRWPFLLIALFACGDAAPTVLEANLARAREIEIERGPAPGCVRCHEAFLPGAATPPLNPERIDAVEYQVWAPPDPDRPAPGAHSVTLHASGKLVHHRPRPRADDLRSFQIVDELQADAVTPGEFRWLAMQIAASRYFDLDGVMGVDHCEDVLASRLGVRVDGEWRAVSMGCGLASLGGDEPQHEEFRALVRLVRPAPFNPPHRLR